MIPNRAAPYSAAEGIAIGLCAATFTGWNLVVTRAPSLAAPLLFALLSASALAAGGLLERLVDPAPPAGRGLPFRLLSGFVLVAAGLLALAWTSPLPLLVDAAILAGALLVSRVALGAPDGAGRSLAAALPDLACIAVGLAAATLWSQDCLFPVTASGDVTVFEPWVDGFNHAAKIATFQRAHGAASIGSFLFAGEPATFNHYGSYLLPALASSLTPATAYQAFASLLVPLGIFLTGLGAAALARSWWGAWPSLGATAALLLLPDAAQLGARNAYYGYHWLQAVAPGGAWGVGALAVAWALLFHGCRSGRVGVVAAGVALSSLAVVFKAQLFVAAAWPILVFPGLFMAGLRPRARVAWVAGANALFFAAAVLSQRIGRMPTLRLDGSATRDFILAMSTFLDPASPVLRFVGWSLPGEASPWIHAAAVGAVHLSIYTFGFLALLVPAAFAAVRRRSDPAALAFPLLLAAVYLAMALGLAADDRGVGTPDELLHRPFAWAYFAWASWFGGACWAALLGDAPPASSRGRVAVALAIPVLAIVPWTLGRGLQSPRLEMPSVSRLAVPSGLVAAAAWVRAAAAPDDAVQDSDGDPFAVVAGLSERPQYASRPELNSRPYPELGPRLARLAELRRLGDAAAVSAFARSLGLRWYILRPGHGVAWPPELLDRPAFADRGFRVYRLY